MNPMPSASTAADRGVHRFPPRTVPDLGLALGLVLAAGLLVACGGGSQASPEDVAMGQAHYQRVCATCHGADAHGLPRLGKDLHDNQFTAELSDDELVEFLMTGRPASHPLNTRGVDMPPRGGDPTMNEEKLRQIVAYLRTL